MVTRLLNLWLLLLIHTLLSGFKIEEAANFLVIFTSHPITYYDTKWLSFLLTRIKLTYDSWDWCKLRKYRNRKVFFLSHLLYRWRKMLKTLNGNPYTAYCIFPSAVWLDDHLSLIFTQIISYKKSIDIQPDVEQFLGGLPWQNDYILWLSLKNTRQLLVYLGLYCRWVCPALFVIISTVTGILCNRGNPWWEHISAWY